MSCHKAAEWYLIRVDSSMSLQLLGPTEFSVALLVAECSPVSVDSFMCCQTTQCGEYLNHTLNRSMVFHHCEFFMSVHTSLSFE